MTTQPNPQPPSPPALPADLPGAVSRSIAEVLHSVADGYEAAAANYDQQAADIRNAADRADTPAGRAELIAAACRQDCYAADNRLIAARLREDAEDEEPSPHIDGPPHNITTGLAADVARFIREGGDLDDESAIFEWLYDNSRAYTAQVNEDGHDAGVEAVYGLLGDYDQAAIDWVRNHPNPPGPEPEAGGG